MNIWKSQYIDECAGSFASHVGHKLSKCAYLYVKIKTFIDRGKVDEYIFRIS